VRFAQLDAGQDTQAREAVPAAVQAVLVAVQVERGRGQHAVTHQGPPLAGDLLARPQGPGSEVGVLGERITGRPIWTARWQVPSIDPASASHDHYLCTWLSGGSTTGPESGAVFVIETMICPAQRGRSTHAPDTTTAARRRHLKSRAAGDGIDSKDAQARQ
jgi:hypothetical protein